MKLDKFTYGKSPAAMYLVLILNERGDKVLARKVGAFLNDHRKWLNELVDVYYHTDDMSVSTFNMFLSMLQNGMLTNANRFEQLIRNLLCNILRGEINLYKNRTIKANRLNQKLAKGAKEGVTVPKIKATPYMGEETLEDKNKRLTERSRAYLARKGKPNTLY